MKFKFEDIEMAYDFVSSSPYGMNSAVLRKDTGDLGMVSKRNNKNGLFDSGVRKTILN